MTAAGPLSEHSYELVNCCLLNLRLRQVRCRGCLPTVVQRTSRMGGATVFTRKGLVGTVVVGVLAGGASAAWPASASADEEIRLPVFPAIYRAGPSAAAERSTTEATPAVGESQSPGTGVLKAALERWRGGGSGGGVPVSTAIYRVEQPEPGESPSTDPTSADDESASTGTDVKFDLVRWRGGWGGGWGRGWGGGWGRGWGWGGGGWGGGWGGGGGRGFRSVGGLGLGWSPIRLGRRLGLLPAALLPTVPLRRLWIPRLRVRPRIWRVRVRRVRLGIRRLFPRLRRVRISDVRRVRRIRRIRRVRRIRRILVTASLDPASHLTLCWWFQGQESNRRPVDCRPALRSS
jgi:hypothetical protein